MIYHEKLKNIWQATAKGYSSYDDAVMVDVEKR